MRTCGSFHCNRGTSDGGAGGAGEVKENTSWRAPLSGWWAAAAGGAALAALLAVARLAAPLPAPLPRDAPPHLFSADRAYDFLTNLTAIGPRVAGSYESEVLGVGVAMEALRGVQRALPAHHRLEVELHRASGAFAISFLDGMTNVYRSVPSVVARLSARAPQDPASRRALLLNCHLDTVPDSPGASDDGAGCAVVVEALRAAGAGGARRHDLVVLLNGAEENIMQGSHAFVTTHRWARHLRAFLNVEACGAGGREVLFQAGPHDPWLLELYADKVPHPFASSLAQELFESGLVPGDTDFRIFRDFGKLSGVDLAWSSNGYVYHTALDTAARVPRDALQRTGDNVLALVHGLLDSVDMDSEVDESSTPPVYFDVLGAFVVCARTPAAAAAVALALALVVLRLVINAARAQRTLFVSRRAWWGCVREAGLRVAASLGTGVACAVTVALAVTALGAPLAFYSRPWLLVPLYGAPALCGAWGCAARLGGSRRAGRGWGAAQAAGDALCGAWAMMLAACAACAVRSGFLPLLWAALPALADLGGSLTGAQGGWRAVWWATGAALPALQTGYLALDWLEMFVPLTGRAGSAPTDVMAALLMSALVLVSFSWTLPYVYVTRGVRKMVYIGFGACALTVALVTMSSMGEPYSPERPQRLMVFHTRRTVHGAVEHEAEERSENLYWVPELDANTARTVRALPALRDAVAVGHECSRWAYCGAPYHLPALSLVPHSLRAPAPEPPLVRARVAASRAGDELALEVGGAAHVVVVVAARAVERLEVDGRAVTPRAGPAWNGRATYLVSLHDASARDWRVAVRLAGGGAVQVAAAAHCQAGACRRAPAHERLLAALPPHTASTGWGVDLHIFDL